MLSEATLTTFPISTNKFCRSFTLGFEPYSSLTNYVEASYLRRKAFLFQRRNLLLSLNKNIVGATTRPEAQKQRIRRSLVTKKKDIIIVLQKMPRVVSDRRAQASPGAFEASQKARNCCDGLL